MMLSVRVDGVPAESAFLRMLLRRAKEADRAVGLVLTRSGDANWVQPILAETGCRATVTLASSSTSASWNGCHALVADAHTSPPLLLEALAAGVCVITPDAPPWAGEDWDDFETAWVGSADAGFYAKVFASPVHVACPGRVALRLGATINPRAIILNGGAGGDPGWVRIGRASHIGADCLLNLGPTSFTVGKFTMISANFSAHATRHSLTHVSNFCIRKGPFAFFGAVNDVADPIVVGNDVWIGERVTALPGVVFADGCVVGAGSVVTRSTEPYGVYAGTPARLIRYRFEPQHIAVLRAAAWWDYRYDRLVRIQDRFQRPVDKLSIDELRDMLDIGPTGSPAGGERELSGAGH